MNVSEIQIPGIIPATQHVVPANAQLSAAASDGMLVLGVAAIDDGTTQKIRVHSVPAGATVPDSARLIGSVLINSVVRHVLVELLTLLMMVGLVGCGSAELAYDDGVTQVVLTPEEAQIRWQRRDTSVEVHRVAAAIRPSAPTMATTTETVPLLDWAWAREQRDKAWRGFLADVTNVTQFPAPNLDGCVRGWKATYGGGTAYGVMGRLLDWALLSSTPEVDRQRALGWCRSHVLHTMDHETYYDLAGGVYVSGEAGPYSHQAPLTQDPRSRDTDLLRHWLMEPYCRAVLEPQVPLTDEERERARAWLHGWAAVLKASTKATTMAVTNVFYEGAHARLWFTVDNLTWAYLATGDRALLEHAEALIVQSLGTSKRGNAWLPAPSPCWAGSDPVECGGRALGNPNAAHRAAYWWHVADSGRRVLPIFVVTENATVRSLLRDWVMTQTQLCLLDGNPMVRGGELRPDGKERPPAEGDPAPWSMTSPIAALTIGPTTKYQMTTACQNWVWDGDYHSTTLSDGRPRMRYTSKLGVIADKDNDFGGADLWWCRYLLTGDELDRARAILLLRDRLWWANSAAKVNSPSTRTGWPYGGGNVSTSRNFAWCVEVGSLIPWDGTAEATIATLR